MLISKYQTSNYFLMQDYISYNIQYMVIRRCHPVIDKILLQLNLVFA